MISEPCSSMPPANWIIPCSWRDHLQLIWIRCGNTSNAQLREILASTPADAVGLLQAGESLVEITGSTFITCYPGKVEPGRDAPMALYDLMPEQDLLADLAELHDDEEED